MSIEKVGKSCCGCQTCINVCPTKAISYDRDKYGFEEARIIHELCINCGKCEKVCPELNHPIKTIPNFCGYAYAKDNAIKKQGSSGGLFGVFAEHIIESGGVVYGAAFDDKMKLKTTSAQNKNALEPLYKSKYLLCDTSNAFKEIERRLQREEMVLYCSSPCQVSALKLFLGKDYNNLFTLEFVCHGVSSQELFDKSIEYSERKINAKILDVNFRHKKKKGSSHYYYYLCEKQGKKFKKEGLYLFFPFYNAYCKEFVYREGCYSCKYACEERVADITIGDFHNIAKYDSTIDRFAGVSMFTVNTEKGKKLYSCVEEKLFTKLMDWEIIKSNNRFHTDSVIPEMRNVFMEFLIDNEFDIVVKKYLNPIKDWKRIIYYHLPKVFRRIALKILGG